MNIFGWFTVFMWALLAASPNTEKWEVRMIALSMMVGTLVFGTGHV